MAPRRRRRFDLSALLEAIGPRGIGTLLLALASMGGCGLNRVQMVGDLAQSRTALDSLQAKCMRAEDEVWRLERRVARLERKGGVAVPDTLAATRPGIVTRTARAVGRLLTPWTWGRTA